MVGGCSLPVGDSPCSISSAHFRRPLLGAVIMHSLKGSGFKQDNWELPQCPLFFFFAAVVWVEEAWGNALGWCLVYRRTNTGGLWREHKRYFGTQQAEAERLAFLERHWVRQCPQLGPASKRAELGATQQALN